MVNTTEYNGESNAKVSKIKGLSTDEKPLNEFAGVKLVNGSTFFEMDTAKVYMYDEENVRWLEL